MFVYLLTPWGKTIGPEVLYESIVHSSSWWPLISPIGILLPPIICHWGPHGGKFPHRLDIGYPIWAPMGGPMGPHWGPNGGQFPPWGLLFFLTPFWRVNTPPRKLSFFVWLAIDPHFALEKYDIPRVKGYWVMHGRRGTLPPWALGTDETFPSSRKPCYYLIIGPIWNFINLVHLTSLKL